MRVVCAVLLAAAAATAHSGGFYKWTDPATREVVYSSEPPPASVKSVEQKKIVPSSVQTSDLPYLVQQAIKRNPITLYVTNCGEFCDAARSFLAQRGLPYTEKNPQNAGDAGLFKKLAGGVMKVPLLVIGNQSVRGFDKQRYEAMLASAGYPDRVRSTLPPKQRLTDARRAEPPAVESEDKAVPKQSSATLLGVAVIAGDLEKFEQWLGRKVDGVLGYTGNRDWNDMDPGWIMSVFPGRHILFSIPLFPQTSSLEAVAGGAGDSHFTAYAQKILAQAKPAPDGNIYVRTGWEMGGEWFPWGAQGKDHPELFIAAFRHFADAFHAVSSKFKIVWDVVGDRGNVEQFYPGDHYVDVISQDFYWNPQWSSTDPVLAFNHYRDLPYGLQWIENFAAQHGKRTAYSEWGVRADNAGPFIEAAKAWFDRNQPVYQTYWNNNSEYPGKLSDGQYPNASATYRRLFGPQ